MPNEKTSEQILAITRELLASGGLGAVSFDAIARNLGRSKQAVLYWYPTKHDLLAAMFLPWLQAEADAAENALADVHGRTDAVGTFVRAVAHFHFADLDRFRMMYLVPQTIAQRPHEADNAKMVDQIHPVTDRLYSALAGQLGGERTTARQEAVAIHAAVMGLILMVALADGLHDPLKHSGQDLVEALVRSLTRP